ncbi:restriction endonuclease subunit S [Xanthomarina gelatinilytica]|uniref:restriction endonuclease subunit S n=1 Tax=Xanthomarina gelatinilytica TaxID=1137281 RepID=UPI003AA86574
MEIEQKPIMNEDWIKCTLGEVCEKAKKVKRKEQLLTQKIKYLDIGGIDNQKNLITSHKDYNWETAPSRAQQIVKVNDVLFSTVRTYLKNIAQVKHSIYHNEICSSGFTVLRAKEDILNPNFLFYKTLSSKFLNDLSKLQTGSSYPAVRDKDVFAQCLLLPPLIEQQAIVNKIEELFSSLDSGIADLKRAQDQLKIYRQAVLKKAFEGEVVRSAKKEKLNNITDKIGSGSTPKGGQANYKESGIPLIRSLNIHFDYIKYEGLAFIDENQADKLKNVIIQEGDVLLNITGASIGRVNIAPKEFENGRVNQHVSIIRPKDNIFYTKYLKLYLQSSKIQNWIANVNVGATRQGLTKSALENLEIPLPSIKEQHQIVQEIESRLSVCDALEKSITESLDKAQALRQSILKKAFEGKLLSEEEIAKCKADKDYEPASVLLEKMKTEKKKK